MEPLAATRDGEPAIVGYLPPPAFPKHTVDTLNILAQLMNTPWYPRIHRQNGGEEKCNRNGVTKQSATDTSNLRP